MSTRVSMNSYLSHSGSGGCSEGFAGASVAVGVCCKNEEEWDGGGGLDGAVGTARTLLLTGPNMGGKSTLLRAACIAVILAQVSIKVRAGP